jgi:hypothetical protein
MRLVSEAAMNNRLDDINAALLQAKQHGVFPSAERADTDMRWLVAELMAARASRDNAFMDGFLNLDGYGTGEAAAALRRFRSDQERAQR